MKLYIDQYCYSTLRLIFTKEELEEIKLDKESLISKETTPNKFFQIAENILIFICHPVHDIVDKIIEISYMQKKEQSL